MNKQYTTVKALVFNDLTQKSVEEIERLSQTDIDNYFQTLVRTKAHLCAKSLKFSTVNRYVEKYLVTTK